jgi:hypothetical protein
MSPGFRCFQLSTGLSFLSAKKLNNLQLAAIDQRSKIAT